jgi:hypothetical protein
MQPRAKVARPNDYPDHGTPTRKAMRRAAAAIALLILAVPAARAESRLEATLTPSDLARLAQFETVRAASIAVARGGGVRRDVDTLDLILAGTPQPLRGEELAGDYRCRVARLGGTQPLVVHDWFRCRIDEDGSGYRLRKLTGSQRTTLRFVDDTATRLVAYGAAHAAGEPSGRYGDDPDADQVGYLVKAEGGRYRIEFPLPRVASRFDILELERR